ncbi:MAG TPA: hypothetical protein ENN30_01815 [Candidatus Woesearchaeota archaeon]|nr:hypothetical protein [Candidatus Woesearchaeota archaeon]
MKVNPADITKDVLLAKEEKKIVFGMKQTIDLLKKGEIIRVIFSQDLPKDVELELVRYSKLKDVPVDEFMGTNNELGIVAKRAHSITMLGFLKREGE